MVVDREVPQELGGLYILSSGLCTNVDSNLVIESVESRPEAELNYNIADTIPLPSGRQLWRAHCMKIKELEMKFRH